MILSTKLPSITTGIWINQPCKAEPSVWSVLSSTASFLSLLWAVPQKEVLWKPYVSNINCHPFWRKCRFREIRFTGVWGTMTVLPQFCYRDLGNQRPAGWVNWDLSLKSTAGLQLLILILHPQVSLSLLDFLSHNIFICTIFSSVSVFPPVILYALSVLCVLCFSLLLL